MVFYSGVVFLVSGRGGGIGSGDTMRAFVSSFHVSLLLRDANWLLRPMMGL